MSTSQLRNTFLFISFCNGALFGFLALVMIGGRAAIPLSLASFAGTFVVLSWFCGLGER